MNTDKTHKDWIIAVALILSAILICGGLFYLNNVYVVGFGLILAVVVLLYRKKKLHVKLWQFELDTED